jgi:hypothetical protein
MSKIVFFPGVNEALEPPLEPEPDIKEIALTQEILLQRWQSFGEELRRRIDGLPVDLKFALCELLRETRA